MDTAKETDKKATIEMQETTAKSFKDLKDKIRKCETVGSNFMQVIKNLDEKYTKVNGTFKKEITAI
jgi:hypothetical protein